MKSEYQMTTESPNSAPVNLTEMLQFIKQCFIQPHISVVDKKHKTQLQPAVFSRVLVNVVKYKLDHMRRRIEMDERDSTNRASFRCPNCCSTFTDLEANQLFDPMTGKDELNLLSILNSSDFC